MAMMSQRQQDLVKRKKMKIVLLIAILMAIKMEIADNFQPTDPALPPIAQLLSLATVTDSDLEAAIEAWKKKPPDPGYELILEAEIED